MAEKLLDGAKIGAVRQEMRGEAVAQGVGADLARDGDGLDPLLNDVSDASICQSTTAKVHEERVRAGAELLPRRQVGVEGGLGSLPKQHHPLLSPLAEHADHARSRIHVREVEAHELRAANAGGVQQLQDGAGAERPITLAREVEKKVDLPLVEMGRNALLETWREQGPRGVAVQDPFPTEEAEEGAEARQLARGRDFLEAPLVQGGEEATDQQVVDLGRPGLLAQLPPEIGPELLEVLAVGAARVAGAE